MSGSNASTCFVSRRPTASRKGSTGPMICFHSVTGWAFNASVTGAQTTLESAANMCANSKVAGYSSQTPYRYRGSCRLEQQESEGRLQGSSTRNLTHPLAAVLFPFVTDHFGPAERSLQAAAGWDRLAILDPILKPARFPHLRSRKATLRPPSPTHCRHFPISDSPGLRIFSV